MMAKKGTPMMRLRTCIPPPPLSEFVDVFWHCQRDESPHAKERLLPTGAVELVVNLAEDRLGPIVSGAHSEPFEIDTSEPATIVGVHFKPGGAFPFLNAPADDLHNAHVPLNDLWGRQSRVLHERLCEAHTPPGMFRVLEQCLLAQVRRPLARHPAVEFALREFRVRRAVSDVTDRIGLSPRHFIQVFADEVGLTPKLFCRVQRFQEVLGLVERRRRVDWAQVAVDCGYYDQSHFIHDFRAFSGLNPTAYLQIRGDHRNHVPLTD
jgi:AraC-like DNA-binding protein